jgi:dTDP-L-rhamnose 4-epimerase
VKVLLAGAAGFVGRPVHDQLSAAGHTIRAFDRILDRRHDITDHDRLLAAASGCDTVIHLAAKVGLGVNIFDIDDYALHNDFGTAVALRVAAEAGISRFVYASSMVVSTARAAIAVQNTAPFARHHAVRTILMLGASIPSAQPA